jgi:hypothetical protein
MPGPATPAIGSNGLHADRMSASDRLDEIGEILAPGLIRLRARSAELERKSSGLSADFGESSLHFSPHQSGRVAPAMEGEETT